MFEQALMPETHRKPWTLGASITLQASIVGSMVLYSAMHVSPLPITIPHLALPMPAAPKLESVAVIAAIIERRAGALNAPVRPFVEPSRIPVGIAHVDDIGSAAPDIRSSGSSFSTGIPGAVFDAQAALKVITPPPPTAVVKPATGPAPLRVGGNVLDAKILKRVLPVYPPLARTMRISGKVHLIGIISKSGVIEKLDVLDGHPLLVRAALEAVRQWIYQPTLLNGEPVDVTAPIEVNFTLTQ